MSEIFSIQEHGVSYTFTYKTCGAASACKTVNKIFFKFLKQAEKRSWQILFYPAIYEGFSGKQIKMISKALDGIAILRKTSAITRIFFTSIKCAKGLANFNHKNALENFEKCIIFALLIVRDSFNLFINFGGFVFKDSIVIINIFAKIIAIPTFILNVVDVKKIIEKLIKTKKILKITTNQTDFKQNIINTYLRQKRIEYGIKLISSLLSIKLAFVLIIGTVLKNKFFSKHLYKILMIIGVFISFLGWVYSFFIRYDMKKYKEPQNEDRNLTKLTLKDNMSREN